MDKNAIKQLLNKTFVNESDPAIGIKNKIDGENKKINKDGVKKIATDAEKFDKTSKKNEAGGDKLPQTKSNYKSEKEKTYHDEMEIMNGQEMIQYDSEPDSLYKKRAEEAIEGSTRMGNNPEWANVVAKGWGADPEFGKNLVKKIKASTEKRNKETPTSKMFGKDWEVVPDEGHKLYAVEGKGSKKSSIKESVMADKKYTHFAIHKPTGKIMNAWNYKDVDKDELRSNPKEYFFNDLNDMSDTFNVDKINKKDVSIQHRKHLDKSGINPEDIKNWHRPEPVKKETGNEVKESFTNNKKTQTTEKMKRITFKEGVMADKKYTHFAIHKPTGKIMNAWNYKDVDKDELRSNPKEYFFNDLNDMSDTFNVDKINKKDVSIQHRKHLDKSGINPEDIKNWHRPEPVKKETGNEVKESFTNNNKTQTTEKIKRITFKKEFNGINNAIKLIPESYKVDNKEFIMTDGNETYKIRWEGSINEGKAAILLASDKKSVNEDILKMKHLFNYKSENTLGLHKPKNRLDEGKSFKKMLNKMRDIQETEDIEGQKAEQGDWDDAVKQSADAKKHVEGSVSTDDGTDAPTPKIGEWDKINIGQASDAKKHIEGSTSDDKGTQAPKPKEGPWELIKVKHAPAAKEPMKSSKGSKQETSAPAAKTGNPDKAVKQAPEAKQNIKK